MPRPPDLDASQPDGSAPDPPAPNPDPVDVFGDVLPDQTRDERSGGADWRADEENSDDRLRRDVPPHY